MRKCYKLLFLLFLALVLGTLYWGCTQPEDILTPVSSSKILLDEEKLPDNPKGMIYELWVADINISDTIILSNEVSLGKFQYDNQLKKYYDSDMTERADSNQFVLADDIMNYDVIFVSLEIVPDDDLSLPGSIMLMANTSKNAIDMVFPMVDTIWEGIVRYNMESTSDGRDSPTDGYSIWFSNYTEDTTALFDTLGIDSWDIDSLSYVPDTIIDTNIVAIIDSTIIVKDTTYLLGLDTVTRTITRFEIVESIDTSDYYRTSINIFFNIDSITQGYFVIDTFSQDEFGLPNIEPYGWKYKGWVVSDLIPKSSVGEITLPYWSVIGEELDDTDGGLLSTGTFTYIDSADDGNPYVVSSRVPPFPGEDFLQNLPGGMMPVNLVPNNSGGNSGRVFISVEPINFTTDTTNFPLIAFIGKLPDSRSFVTDSLTQQFTLRGWMYSNDPFRGFPKIRVNVERF